MDREGLGSRKGLFALTGVTAILLAASVIYWALPKPHSTNPKRTSPAIFQSRSRVAAHPKSETKQIPQAPSEKDEAPVASVEEEQGGLVISGHVFDQRHNPVAGAQIRAVGNPPDAPNGDPARSVDRKVASEKDGAYRITGLPPWKFDFFASHDDFSNWTKSGVPAGTENLDIIMPDLGAIEGRVVSAATNLPVTAFDVTAKIETASFSSPDMMLTGTDGRSSDRPRSGRELLGGMSPDNLPGFQPMSDEAGRFRIDRVKANKMVVAVRAEGFVTGVQAAGRVEPGKTLTGVEVRLEPECVVSGVVVDIHNRPIEGVAVLVDGPFSSLPLPFALRSDQQSDAAGAFRLAKLESIPPVIYAWKEGYAPAETDIVGRGPKVEHVVVVLTSGGSVEGVVKVGDRPAMGARVLVGSPKDRFSHVGDTNADADGRYRIDGIAPGDWIVDVAYTKEMGNMPNAPDLGVRRPVVVEEGQVTRVDFIFETNAALQGAVTAGGVPCQAEIEIVQEALEDSRAWVKTDAGGHYHVEGLLAGPITMRVRPEDEFRGRCSVVAVTVVAGQTTYQDVDILKSSRIAGRVTGIEGLPENAEIGGALLAGHVEIEDLTLETIKELEPSLVEAFRLESDGTFIVNGPGDSEPPEREDIVPGTYTVLVGAFAEGAEPAELSEMLAIGSAVIEVREGEETTVEIQLHPPKD